jgi:hypothetical protein
VVCEHLSIILALLLDVDHEHLLDPETPLDEVIPLENTLDLPEWPAFPDAVEVQPEVRVVHDVLSGVSLECAELEQNFCVPCLATTTQCSILSAMPAL